MRFSHSENLGEVVVYQWVEWIKDYITSKAEELQGAAHANILKPIFLAIP